MAAGISNHGLRSTGGNPKGICGQLIKGQVVRNTMKDTLEKKKKEADSSLCRMWESMLMSFSYMLQNEFRYRTLKKLTFYSKSHLSCCVILFNVMPLKKHNVCNVV